MKRSKRPVSDLTAVEVVPRKDNDVTQHWFWFGYVTKGALPCRLTHRDTGVTVHLEDLMLRRPEACGTVRCRKRVGVSRNLDRKARRNWPGEVGGFWSRLNHTPIHRKDELYIDEYWQAYELERQIQETSNALKSLVF